MMETPDLSKMRRFALAIALILITLVLAEVEIETPARIAPLGFPLVIKNPNLLTWALVIASIYAVLRYVYYGMLVQPSPMHVRRILLSGQCYFTPNNILFDEFCLRARKEIYRYFPSIGSTNISCGQDASGCIIKIEVPTKTKIICWIENIDFLLPIIANVAAITLWIIQRSFSSS